jgi:hypothetical protein
MSSPEKLLRKHGEKQRPRPLTSASNFQPRAGKRKVKMETIKPKTTKEEKAIVVVL